MHQIKIFKSIESEARTMEEEINDWIKSEQVKILSITGNIAPQSGGTSAISGSFSGSDVLLIVLYEK